MSRSKLRRYRHEKDAGELPYEAVLGRTVTVKHDGELNTVTAEEAFILRLKSKAAAGDASAAMLLEEAQIEDEGNLLSKRVMEIVRRIVAPGSVTHSLELLRMARKFDRYTEHAHMKLEPWIVEAALARLGDQRLSKEEQRIVLAATRTPHKVKWPRWWTERPPA